MIAANSETLVARIEDSGREFDPTQFPPCRWQRRSRAKVGDLGIHLMRTLRVACIMNGESGHLRLTLLFVELH